MAEENLIYELDISWPCLNMSRAREKDHPAMKGRNKLQREVTTGGMEGGDYRRFADKNREDLLWALHAGVFNFHVFNLKAAVIESRGSKISIYRFNNLGFEKKKLIRLLESLLV